MQILESTKNRLVIGREHSTSYFELINLALLVNILVSIFGLAIAKYLPSHSHSDYFFVILFAISWLLVHLSFPGDKIDASYWFVVISGSIPFAGTLLLSMFAIMFLQVPQIVSLTFDRNKNLLIIKKGKILFWYPIIQYPLDAIIAATLVTKKFVAGSTTLIPTPVIQLSRRKQNGRIVEKDILAGKDADYVFVDRINRFLLNILR